MKEIMGLLEDFDPAALLPELDSALGKIETLLRLAIMVGPIIILVLGILYFVLPPREANHSFGYRFFWGMSSVESWRFTQRVAGLIWSLLGVVLTILMQLQAMKFRGMETMEMIWVTTRCLLWEFGLVAVSCLLIDLIVIVFFNAKGDRRGFTVRKKKVKAEK